MTSSLVKAAPPSEGFEHPQNGAAVRYLEEPPGVGSTRGEGTLGGGVADEGLCAGQRQTRSFPGAGPGAPRCAGGAAGAIRSLRFANGKMTQAELVIAIEQGRDGLADRPSFRLPLDDVFQTRTPPR